jgi:hypothetical protein
LVGAEAFVSGRLADACEGFHDFAHAGFKRAIVSLLKKTGVGRGSHASPDTLYFGKRRRPSVFRRQNFLPLPFGGF